MRLLGWLFWATLSPILFLQLRGIGAPLEMEGVAWGIVSLELAFTSARATQILSLWKSAGVTESALVSLGVDGAFLIAYPMLLYTSIRVLLDRAVAASHPLHRLGTRLAWASLACIPLDALENVLLWRVVSRGAAGSDILLAGIAASLKFLLIAAALIWIVAALQQWRTARNTR
jgi:hypothetical protein